MTERVNITLDIQEITKAQLEKLAKSILIVRYRGGDESPNMGNIARIVLAVVIANQGEFIASYEYKKPEGTLYRFNFQTTDEQVKELESVGWAAKITRMDEGKEVPNMTQIIRSMLEYGMNNPAIVLDWFTEKIKGGMEI